MESTSASWSGSIPLLMIIGGCTLLLLSLLGNVQIAKPQAINTFTSVAVPVQAHIEATGPGLARCHVTNTKVVCEVRT